MSCGQSIRFLIFISVIRIYLHFGAMNFHDFHKQVTLLIPGNYPIK